MILLKRHFYFLLIGAIVIVGGFLILIFSTPEENNKNNQTDFPIIKRTITMHIGNKTSETKTLPVDVTEKIASSKPLDGIYWWEIVPEWNKGSRPGSFFSVTDENLNDIIDYSRPPTNAPLSTRLMGFHVTDVLCNGQNERASFVSVPILSLPTIPVKDATSTVLVKYHLNGIDPVFGTGIYNIKFWSFYDVKIELPRGATITSDNIRICSISNEAFYENFKARIADPHRVILYDMSFTLD